MKKYKGLILIIILLLGYVAAMYFVFNTSNSTTQSTKPNNSNNKVINKDYYMVVGDNGLYKYENNKFIKASKRNIESQSNMKIYVDNKFFGNYKMNYVATWNLLNDKSEFVSYNGNLLAISSDFDVVVKEYKTREIDDNDKVLLLKNYSINSFKYLTVNKVIDIDLDKNGEMDEVICLSSMEFSENVNNYYNLVILKYNNNIITIIDERGNDALAVYNITSIVNILNEKSDSIILKKIESYYGETQKVSNIIVRYKNDNYMID